MMFSWIRSPLGRWLSLAGAIVTTLGIAWLKGRAAGKAAWEKIAGQHATKPCSNQRRSDMTYRLTAMLLLISVSIAGCATDPLTRSDCDWAQPIKPSRKDVLTRQTKEQIAAHNKIGSRVCRWKY